MTLFERIVDNLHAAMKAQDVDKVRVLRMLKAQLMNAAIATGTRSGLSDEEALKVLRREAKHREESAAAFDAGNRSDLATIERHEFEIISTYMPPSMNDEDIRAVVLRVHAEMSDAPFGQLMNAAMKEFHGSVDGNRVRAMVNEVIKQN